MGNFSTKQQYRPYVTQIIEPSKIKDNFEVVCGIDFGTDGVGLAYSIPFHGNQDDNDKYENKQHHQMYEDIILHSWKKKLATRYIKKKAQILLDVNGKLQVFGEGASRIMEEFEDPDSDSDDDRKQSNKQQKRYKLIDTFKMSLYDDPRWKDINAVIEDVNELNQVNLFATVSSKDGTQFETEKVFIETLKYLKKEATRFIKKELKKKNIKKHDIQWILTIPAIWSNKAKTNMRNWAIKAGLISGKYINQLRMVLEPECAALHIQYLIRSEQSEEKLNIIHQVIDEKEEKHPQNIAFKTGDKYILIDAGAGTVDIVSHEIIGFEDFGVKEIYPAKGGAFGSTIIDEQMMNMFYELFTKEMVERFAMSDQRSYVQLVQNMIWSKCQFNDDKTSEYHSIEIPMNLINFMEENVKQIEGNLENYLSAVQNLCDIYNGKQLIRLTTDYMQIHKEVWMKWFDKCIDRILVDCDTILNDDKMKNNQCQYMFLVGGLAESKYFQQKMIEYAEKMTIIIPSRSILSVVQGAARWGIVPNFVLSRKSTKSYGIGVSQQINHIQRFNLSQDYVDTHQQEIYGEKYVTGILNVFAKKGDDIKLHHVFRDKYYRRSIYQTAVNVSIYESENDEIPKTVEDTDVRRMGFFTLEFPLNSNEMNINVEYSFDDTILVVTAKWGDHSKRIHIQHSEMTLEPDNLSRRSKVSLNQASEPSVMQELQDIVNNSIQELITSEYSQMNPNQNYVKPPSKSSHHDRFNHNDDWNDDKPNKSENDQDDEDKKSNDDDTKCSIIKSKSAPNPTTSKLRANAPIFTPITSWRCARPPKLSTIQEKEYQPNDSSLNDVTSPTAFNIPYYCSTPIVFNQNDIITAHIVNAALLNETKVDESSIIDKSSKETKEFKESQQSKQSNNQQSKPSKKSKRKMSKRARKKQEINIIKTQYDPNDAIRGLGNIKISNKFVQTIIPEAISENQLNLYSYIDKMTAMQHNNKQILEINDGKMRIHNYDFHDKNTNETLYILTEKIQETKHRGFKYQMIEQLFTAKRVSEYGIDINQLPKSPKTCSSFIRQLSHQDIIRKKLSDPSEMSKIIKKTKWQKQESVPIFRRFNGKRSVKLSLEKMEFISQLTNYAENEEFNLINLIPIVMFNNNNQHWIEYIWIVKVDDNNVNIGISFGYNTKLDKVSVTGIHLDKSYILDHHQLVGLNPEEHKCDCLSDFKSNISDFCVYGRPNEDKIRIKELKTENADLKCKNANLTQQIKELKVQLSSSDHEIQSNLTFSTSSQSVSVHDYV